MVLAAYKRGFDLKLGKDAYTYVIATSSNYSWSDVQQMIGRGCRSFGYSEGCYMTTLIKEGSDLKQQLLNYEHKIQDGVAILAAIYDNEATVIRNHPNSLKDLAKNLNWCTKKDKILSMNEHLYQVLFNKNQLAPLTAS